MNPEMTIFESKLLGEKYILHRHSSGLPIYVFPKKMETTFALFGVNFGSVDRFADPAGQNPLPDGVAHFLEHKLFSNEDGSDSFEHFSAFGADANAYTAHTRTVYLFSCTDRFEDSFGELINFVTHPFFTPETVKKEQGIIGEEIRMCLDDPYDRCYYNMLEGLYRNHPVKKDICGSVSSIAQITDQTLYEAYRTFYTLSNMVLVVCGDVDPEKVIKEASAHLPAKGNDVLPPRNTVAEEPCAHLPTVFREGQVAKPVFSIGVKDTDIPDDPFLRAKKDACMSVLNEMLFSEAGELYNHLFDAGLISPDLSAEYVLTRDFAFNQICGEAWDPEAVLFEIQQYIEQKKKSGLSVDDFERCRKIEYAEYIKSFDSTEEIANTLLSFVFENADLFSFPDIILGLTLKDVQNCLNRCFDPAYYTLSAVFPLDGEKKGN